MENIVRLLKPLKIWFRKVSERKTEKRLHERWQEIRKIPLIFHTYMHNMQ